LPPFADWRTLAYSSFGILVVGVAVSRRKSETIAYFPCRQADPALARLVYFEMGLGEPSKDQRALFMHIAFGRLEHPLPGGSITFRLTRGQLKFTLIKCILIPQSITSPAQDGSSLVALTRKGSDEIQRKRGASLALLH
jgi:hypothetical protein